MAITTLIVLAAFTCAISLGAFEPDLFLKRRVTGGAVLSWIVLAIGHAVVIDQDLQRRGFFHKGGLYVYGGLFAPPFAALVYLIRVYRGQAWILIPLYFGLIGLASFAGRALGWLYLQAQ